ncbi:leucine-rich repeat and IQ domain-containing protein 1 [Bombina bombina]|uniref:leucine-rich repeat and IQ domain-containing protein 1 n=1 Tax=Bombina bombina TaxID=8345 RepID=UPI00235AECB0|nr:leucine-rich repeat and IQ domain-containing protein 1 [Bombina bombina]
MDEEIELELSNLPLLEDAHDDSYGEEEYEEVQDNEENEVENELPESVLSCLQFVKSRSEKTEKLILESDDTWISECFKSVTYQTSDYLAELASEYDEEPDALRKRILADLEEDDKRDQSSSAPENDLSENETPGNNLANKLGSGDIALNLDYIEVEENCRQQLLQWETEQEKQHEETKNKLISQRQMLQKQMQEQLERSENRRKEFENKTSMLNILHKQQQETIDEEMKKNNEALAEDLKKHEGLINKLQADIEKERNIFEEQKTKAKKHLEEIQHNSAIKIQAKFRAFHIYKEYAPILKERKEERKKKRELQLKMEEEKKEMEAKIKRKLEERKQKEEEKKQKEEMEKRKIAEAEKQECLKQEMRRKQYEKKKEEEKKRLEKEKVFKQEEKIEKRNKILENSTVHQNTHEIQSNEVTLKTNIVLELKRNEEIREEEIKQSEGKHVVNGGIKILTEGVDSTNIQTKKINIKNMNSSTYVDSCAPDFELKEEHQVFVGSVQTVGENKCTESDTMYLQESETPTSSYNKENDPEMSLVTKTPNVTPSQEEISQNSQETSQTAQSKVLVSVSTKSFVLPDNIEEIRLAWMKSCKPWFKILKGNQRKKVLRKTKQRKSSAARKLPAIHESIILQNTPWHSLKQVTAVTLNDLPGCSLSTLSECTKLKYLSMKRCHLISLEGISSCRDLQYIDLQENCIQIINCEDLEKLCILLLNKNQISSIHGLDSCTNLRNLELSFNSITKIGGLDSLKNLQRLVLDHNQLIDTSGLEAAPTIMYLDCSYNFLTELDGIQNCGLLQVLRLQGNNLTKPPQLHNHVLLREIYLDDNSLSRLDEISSYWLPLLQVFSVSKNSLIQLSSLNTLISLEELDISSNCLSDLQSILLWLEGCRNVRSLSLSKNPCLQECNWRCTVLKILPSLKLLNSELLHSEDGHFKEEAPQFAKGTFWTFCQEQIYNMNQIWQKLNTEGWKCSSMESLENSFHCFEDLMKLSNEQRYAHEYGDMETNEREEPESLGIDLDQAATDSHQTNNAVSDINENKQDDLTRKITANNAQLVLINPSVYSKNSNHINNIVKMSMANQDKVNLTSQTGVLTVKNKERTAAVVIQSHWRGYMVRRDIRYYEKLHEAASVIQSFWRQYCVRKATQKKNLPKPSIKDIRDRAATVIQSTWKGFRLRKKLAAAFAAIERDELEDDLEEVNLDDFLYDDALEKDWILDSPNFPSKTQHLSIKPKQPKLLGNISAPQASADSFPRVPYQAWPSHETAEVNRTFIHKRAPLDKRLEKQDLSNVTNMKSDVEVSFKSGKEEQIFQEWGFRDASTVQLMLKRAQKMKSKQPKMKKMLDPAVRLALFKHNENKHVPVKPPKKVQSTNTEYLQDKEQLFYLDEVPSEKLARSRELTFQWLHTQCGDVDAASPGTVNRKRFLPELNHEVLSGGRVQLVTNARSEPMDLEIVSVTSASSTSQKKERNKEPRRQSRGPSSNGLYTPVKSDSGAPRKERISFRDNPLQLSGGWGCGKRRGNK